MEVCRESRMWCSCIQQVSRNKRQCQEQAQEHIHELFLISIPWQQWQVLPSPSPTDTLSNIRCLLYRDTCLVSYFTISMFGLAEVRSASLVYGFQVAKTRLC
jgi:hypothetical protein